MICGCIGIVAEVSYEALKKRYDQGWVLEIFDDLDKLMARIIKARAEKEVSVYPKYYTIHLLYSISIHVFCIGNQYRVPWQRGGHLGEICAASGKKLCNAVRVDFYVLPYTILFYCSLYLVDFERFTLGAHWGASGRSGI